MKGKVLIVGPDFWGYNDSVARAFNKLGYKTEIVSYSEGRFNNPDKKMLPQLLNIYEEKRKTDYNDLIIKKYYEFKPDIFFVIKGTVLLEETLKKVTNAIKILWMMDSLYRFANVLANTKYFDYLFMYEKTDVELLQAESVNSFFLPMAFDEAVYYPIPELKKDIDIFFIGGLNDARLDILYQLMDDFKGKNLKFFGKRVFTRNKPFKYFSNKSVFPNKTLNPNEVNRYYNRSKICINLHKIQSKDGVNPRFFEIIGAKGLQIVDENPFIDDHFMNEVFTFSNYKELKQTIIDNLDTLRNPVIDIAYNKVVNNHTFTHRIDYVLHKIMES